MKDKGDLDLSRTGELNTIVGKGTVIKGDMKIQNSLRVDGLVTGNITSTETVVVGKEGEVQGHIKAKHVMLAGRVKGHVTAAGKVYLESKAVVLGDIKAIRLVIDDGAVFDGNCIMQGSGSSNTEDSSNSKDDV